MRQRREARRWWHTELRHLRWSLSTSSHANVRYYMHPPFLPRAMCELVPVGTTHVRLVDGQEAPYTTATEGLLVWVRLMQLGLERDAITPR